MMKTLISAAALFVAAGIAPVMAQAVQPVAPNAAVAAPAQPSAPAWATAVFSADKRGEADGMVNGYGQPNQVYGVPGGNQASPSPHAAP